MRHTGGPRNSAAARPRLVLAAACTVVLLLLLEVLTAGRAGASARAGAAGRAPAGGQPAAQQSRSAAASSQNGIPAGQTVVSFTFDDGDADQLMAARTLHRYGMNGTFYIISGAVGDPGYMSRADLRKLTALGDEIGGHTASHLELTHIPAAEARRQVCLGRDTLLRWGFRVTSFAYPGAVYNAAAERVVRACGFDSARIATGLRSASCPGCAATESAPPARPYAVRAPGQIDQSWTLADLKQLVVNAERHGGGWLPLIFHHICTGKDCTSLSVRSSTLNAFAAWLSHRRAAGTVVRTVGQIVGGPVRPAVGAPAARPHGVINASLERLNNSGSVDPAIEAPGGTNPFPKCWKFGAYGQNQVRHERIRDARSGRWAFRLTMTSHASGDAKMLQQFDTGACSLPVRPGASYSLSAWYTSTVQTQYEVYYRDASGRWVFWAASPFFAASGQWSEAGWQTPPVPDGARGISFGLAIAAKGTLTTDDYAFSNAPPNITRRVLDITLLSAIALIGIASGARAIARRRARRGTGGPAGPPSPGGQPARVPGRATGSSSSRP